MGVLPCLFTCREIFSLLEWKMTEYDGILIVACLPYVFLYGFKFLSSRKTYKNVQFLLHVTMASMFYAELCAC